MHVPVQHKLSVAGEPQSRIATLVLAALKFVDDQLLERLAGENQMHDVAHDIAHLVRVNLTYLIHQRQLKLSFFLNLSETSNSLVSLIF